MAWMATRIQMTASRRPLRLCLSSRIALRTARRGRPLADRVPSLLLLGLLALLGRGLLRRYYGVERCAVVHVEAMAEATPNTYATRGHLNCKVKVKSDHISRPQIKPCWL